MSMQMRLSVGPTRARARRYIAQGRSISLPSPLPTDTQARKGAYEIYLQQITETEAQLTNVIHQLI